MFTMYTHTHIYIYIYTINRVHYLYTIVTINVMLSIINHSKSVEFTRMSRFHIVTIDPLPNDNHEDHHDDHEDDHRVDHDDVIDTSALTPCLVNNTSSTSSTRSSGSTDRDDSPTRPLIKPSAISPEVENRLNVISGNAITRRFSDNRGCNDLQRNQASIRRIGTWAMDFKSCNIGSS